jgi:predicted MFS family arabinose efflux permease
MTTASRKTSATHRGFAQLAVAWFTTFVIGCDLFAGSPLLPLIVADYDLPTASAGSSVTVFALTYGLSAPALGHIADRIGRRPVLTCSLVAFGAANLLTAIAPSFTVLLIARFLAGAAAAGVSPSV